MLYHFLYPLADMNDLVGFFNLFRYITFRAILAAMLGMVSTVVIGHFFIKFMRNKKNVLRRLTPDAHKKKEGTPGMGGVVILISVAFTILLTGNFQNNYLLICIASFILFACIGFYDDFKKMVSSDGRGISFKTKIFFQLFVAVSICWMYIKINEPIVFYSPGAINISNTDIVIPFFKELFVRMGVFYYFFFAFILVASSNAVNLTDGLDGLAVGLSLLVISSFGVFAYASGHFEISEYLKIVYLENVGEVTVFVSALAGSCLGFLWYNAHPAQMFMGDTGSLSLGGVMGMLAIVLKLELLLPIIAGVFVIETMSVILQVGSFKLFKKRIFKMAPIHHHFEMMGIKESKIIARFWIVGVLFLLLALSSLKVR